MAKDLNALLSWLDPDDQSAGKEYEAIRRRLIQFFALRQCSNPEELADQTIERVARRASEIAASYHGEPGHYFYAVARNVLRENSRRPQELTEDLPVSKVEKDDRLYECFDKCMLTLTADTRELLQAYYEEGGRARADARRRLAAQLGLTVSALRIRVCIIRMTMRECVENCMKSQREESNNI